MGVRIFKFNILEFLETEFFYQNPTQHRILQKHVRNISNLSLQLKYCSNIFVNYSNIFHCNITILTFWNILVNK